MEKRSGTRSFHPAAWREMTSNNERFKVFESYENNFCVSRLVVFCSKTTSDLQIYRANSNSYNIYIHNVRRVWQKPTLVSDIVRSTTIQT